MITPSADGALLLLKVAAGSNREEIGGAVGDRLRVRVRAVAEKGRANRAVVELLEQALDLPSGAAEIVAGPADSRKTVLVRGMDAETLRQRVAMAMAAAAAKGRRR